MNVILYMAMTVNGNIARPDGATDWTSKEDWQSFRLMAKKAGAIIIGRRTYDVMRKENQRVGAQLCIVITRDLKNKTNKPRTIFTDASPEDILEMVADRGFQTVLVAGGGQINSLFLKAGLIDEIFVDIEPLILGRGVPLFADADFDARLELLSVHTLNRHTIQLHYAMKK